MRLGIFGGSFDPPHIGHVLSATTALISARLDKLLVIPCFEHAFDKKYSASFEERLAMTKITFEQLTHVEVSDIERDLPKPSYTINTLRELSLKYMSAQLVLVVGADVMLENKKWHEFDEIVKLAELFVVRRSQYQEVSHKLFDGKTTGIEIPNVNSTQIRSILKLKRQSPEIGNTFDVGHLLDKRVEEYIEQNKLYVC